MGRTTPLRPTSVDRAALQNELSRQRTELLNGSGSSLTVSTEPGTLSDLADQSSVDCEQDIAIKVKSRTFDRLRCIEQALRAMQAQEYGRCRRCCGEIPAKRLKVQPDALYCVTCQTWLERSGRE